LARHSAGAAPWAERTRAFERYCGDRDDLAVNSGATIDDWQGLLPARLVHASTQAAGSPISLRQYRFDEDAVIELPGLVEHTMCFVVGRTAVFEKRDRGQWVRRVYRAGEGGIVPAGVSVSSRLIGSAMATHLYMNAAWFDAAAAAELGVDSRRVRLLGRSWLQDSFLWMFVAGLLRRTRAGPPLEGMISDAAALGLACYLIRAHSSASDRFRPAQLTQGRGQVADFIDEEVATEFGLGEFAQAIGVARRELLGCFTDADPERLRTHTGHWRIHWARTLLQGSAIPVNAIAHVLGFRTRASLDIASQFAFGCTAAELREVSTGGAVRDSP
jgi:AraC-like DNA-binding protein